MRQPRDKSGRAKTMNIRRGLLRAWVVFSVLWVAGSAAEWHATTEGDRAQITASEECGKIYPALPEAIAAPNPTAPTPNSCAGKVPPCDPLGQFASSTTPTQDSGADPWLESQGAPHFSSDGKLEVQMLPPLQAAPKEAPAIVTQTYEGLPPGYHLDLPAGSAGITVIPIDVWEAAEAKRHPHCAPTVGGVSLTDFATMHIPEREALRQGSMDAIRTSTIAAVAYGAALPAGLLVLGLLVSWVERGFRGA